jgi:asparagine synthase (glutamine-hydrolysing)
VTERDAWLPPSEIEVLFGYPLRSGRSVVLPPGPACDPADCLVDVVGKMLDRASPTLVEFSGGVDSSLVLSAATRAARRAGWPDPVPVTYRYANAPATDESAFQELVVGHLGLREWRILDLTDEHDVVGPAAMALLDEVGSIMPGVLAGKAGSLPRLSGHRMLNGEGGDAVLGARRITSAITTARHLRHGELRGAARRARDLPRDLAPRALRARLIARDIARQYGPPWVADDVRRDLSLRSSHEDAAEPLDPRRYFEHYLSLTGVWVLQQNARMVRAHFGVTLASPLIDPEFLAVLAASVARSHWTSRYELVGRYFATLLPKEIVERQTKAEFSDAYFAGPTRSFARTWDGSGLPEEADAAWLKRHWAEAERVHGGSTMLLQRAALAAAHR